LIKENTDKFAQIITSEHGKTISDAKGEIQRGLEVVEHATAMASLSTGETVMNVARGIDCHSYKVPIGVCSGILPFNFPFMIPCWMFPIAVTLGNTYVMKPSEKVPMSTMYLCELT